MGADVARRVGGIVAIEDVFYAVNVKTALKLGQVRGVAMLAGVSYERILRWTATGPIALYVITAPKPGGLYTLTPLLSNGTIVGRETVS